MAAHVSEIQGYYRSYSTLSVRTCYFYICMSQIFIHYREQPYICKVYKNPGISYPEILVENVHKGELWFPNVK